MSKVKKTEDNKAQESSACGCGADDCGTNELKSIIQSEVSMYKDIWTEVKAQFSESSEETQIKIFGSIAPYIGDMITMTAAECLDDEEEEAEEENRKGKKRKK